MPEAGAAREQLVRLAGDELLHCDQLVDEIRTDLQGAGFPRAVFTQVHAKYRHEILDLQAERVAPREQV